MAPKTERSKQTFRPGHLILFIVFIIVRKSFANESDHSSHDTSGHDQRGAQTDHTNLNTHSGGHDGHKDAHFSVFHVNFHHVEVPFIIALWIFVSSLAKVGRYSVN